MHYRMLVTTAQPEGATSQDVRAEVHAELLSDQTFCGSGGRFGTPICDWFVIGGRWSGLLAEIASGEPLKQALRARFPRLLQGWWPSSLAQEHGAEIDAIWQSHGGTGASPYTRNADEDLGFPDDAMVVTTALYDELLSEYEGRSVSDDGYVDLEGESLSVDFVGRKWLVIVDCHN